MVGTWPTEVVVEIQNVVLVEGCGCVLTGWVVAAAVVVAAHGVERGWGRTPTACPHGEYTRSTAPSGRNADSLGSSWISSSWFCSWSLTSCSCCLSFLSPSHHPPNHQLVPPHKFATSSPQQPEHLPLPHSDVQQYPICASTLPTLSGIINPPDYPQQECQKNKHIILKSTLPFNSTCRYLKPGRNINGAVCTYVTDNSSIIHPLPVVLDVSHPCEYFTYTIPSSHPSFVSHSIVFVYIHR